jgi:serine/threonine protein kinase
VAPEVLNGGEIDERTDIYSIGKFIESLFVVSSMPYQYKKIVARATQSDPLKRYQTVADLRRDLSVRSKLYKSLITLAAAAVVALIALGIFWDLTPTTTPVEFVKPVPRQATDDLIDDGFDPRTELGVVSADSAGQLSPAEQKKQAEYQKKNEEIFRKQYAVAAAKIINKVYNKEYMGANEKKFIAGSQSTLDELSKLQTDLGNKAHLTNTKSQKIAADVIEGITEQKMDQMMGGQRIK